MNKQDKALRNVSYGIGLQIFIGIGFLGLSLGEQEFPESITDPSLVGGVLIMLAVNSLCYVRRYKKVLKEEG